jgi:thymidylate kinase/predicted kinase
LSTLKSGPPFVVMLNGHAGCLKTTLSYLLAPGLNAGHVSTSLFGPIVPDRASKVFLALRDKRYSLAMTAAAAYLRSGTSVVIDGTFALRRWRERLYQIAEQHGAQELIAITCGCSDIKRLEERFRHRADNADVPDAAAHSIDAYRGSVAEFEALDADDIPRGVRLSILSFDSCTGTVTILKPGEKGAAVVGLISLLQKNGMFARPLFKSVSREAQGNPMVLLEGIGGSGKSTQAALLQNPLREYFGINPVISGEFSSSPLGRFIDSSRRHGLRISPVDDHLAQNFLVITDLISCFIKTQPRRAVHILDSGILGRLAHLEALRVEEFPVDAWNELLETTSQVLERLIIGNSSAVSVFLDCPVEIAIDRLRGREGELLAKDGEFLHRLSGAFRKLVARRPGVAVIDAVGSPKVVSERIVTAVTARLCQ